MSEEGMAAQAPRKLTDPNEVPVVFINDVAGLGFSNGVINLTLATARFTPDPGGIDHVELDRIIAARLRMDLFCAQQLVANLQKIIEDNTKGPAQTPAKMN